MILRDFLRFYRLSALGIGCLFGALAVGLAASLSSPLLGAGAFVGALVVLDGACLLSGLAARAAAREEGRRLATASLGRLAAVAADLDRLEALRIAEPSVAAAKAHLVLEARSYLEACRRGLADPGATSAAYDPRALATVSESLALVDAWQREADETATERRFQAADAHPQEGGPVRIAESLKEATARLQRAKDLATGYITADDRLSTEEELPS